MPSPTPANHIEQFLEIMRRLRDPETGCPWDIKQNFKTIAPYTIEEAYEVADAIEREHLGDIKEELGDLLFQVVFHAQLADELGAFNFNDVVESVSEKMQRRHPHVFGDSLIQDEEALDKAWEAEKKREQASKSNQQNTSILDGVTLGLPSLMRAQKLQKKASKVGFDWSELAPVLSKVTEELIEVKEAIQQQNQEAINEEVGDLLFSVVNVARHLDVDAEDSLRAANNKFSLRFKKIERLVKEKGEEMDNISEEEFIRLWKKAKS